MNDLYRPMPSVKELYSRLKQSAKKRNIPFDLTLSDMYQISFPLTCPILGIRLRWYWNKGHDDSYSFDRIDSSIGYTFDNIQIISNKANRAKNNLTKEELKKFGDFFVG